MNICSVSWDRPDISSSGIEVRLWKLSKAFKSKDCNVHLVFSRSANPNSLQEQVVDAINLHGVGPRWNLPIIGDLIFGLIAARKIKQIDKKENIDIFTFHGPFALSTLFITKKSLQKPLVYYTPTALPFEARKFLFKNIRPLFYFLRKLRMYSSCIPLELMAIKYADKVIVPSKASAHELLKCYRCQEAKAKVIPSGQDFYRYSKRFLKLRRNFKSNQKKLLFVGNDWHRKGVKYLLLAFKEVLEKEPKVNLTLTGPGQEPFISLAKKLKVDSHIIYAGNVSEKTLAQLYAQCDIFVLPSLHEGFGIPVIEAMAFGKPVITTTMAGCQLVENGKNGFAVEPEDYRSIAHWITELLKDQKLYGRISKNAVEKAKMFTWKKSADATLVIYRALLGLNKINECGRTRAA